jgi:hypothetical protein
MRKPKVIIEDWTIEVKGRSDENVHVYEDSQEKKKIALADFEENGMIRFPKKLYKLITGSYKNSNTYDRFVDKFYDYMEEQYDA